MSGFHGKFCWYELMTTDNKAAEGFYGKVLGWRGQDMDGPHGTYTILSVGETGIGGVMALPPDLCAAGARPGWSGYVSVDDVDDYAVRVKQAGGTVHREPADIPGIARFAVVADPDGAVFNLIKGFSTEPPKCPPPGTPGHTGWRELYAGNWESAWAFYSGLFGWTKAEAHDMGPMGIYQLFSIDGVLSGGMMTKPEQMPAPSWLYYFNVDDIDAATVRVKQNGGQILHGPMEVPGGSWIVQCADPQGAMFALLEPGAATT
jgi:predicted enzyme related to lactoylglutathione lyase